MKSNSILSILLFSLIIGLYSFSAKEKPTKIQTIQMEVNGCCKQCKDRIESALDVKGVRFAEWNKETKQLTVTYKTTQLNTESIHQLVSSVGHDTELMTAPESVYNALPGCCKYRGGTKCAH